MGNQQSRTAKPTAEQYELDTSEPLPERQVDLRNARAKNMKEGKPPYADVEFWSLGELQWVIHEHGWSGEPLKFSGVRADLRHAGLSSINFSGVRLDRADLSDANLGMANLAGANLSGAILRQANLSGANLTTAHLSKETNLEGVIFDIYTRLADVDWNGVKLTQLAWEPVERLGDDYYAGLRRYPRGPRIDVSTRLRRYQAATRAYRQLALTLRKQGLNEYANRFSYHAQVMARKAVLREVFISGRHMNTPFPWAVRKPPTARQRGRKFASYLGLVLLEFAAGYGYRVRRAAGTYLLIIGIFTLLYLINAQFAAPHLTWDEALVLSVSSFHGRGFFTSGVSLGDNLARIAAGEAIIGLLIEITFIATFTQRFFAR